MHREERKHHPCHIRHRSMLPSLVIDLARHISELMPYVRIGLHAPITSDITLANTLKSSRVRPYVGNTCSFGGQRLIVNKYGLRLWWYSLKNSTLTQNTSYIALHCTISLPSAKCCFFPRESRNRVHLPSQMADLIRVLYRLIPLLPFLCSYMTRAQSLEAAETRSQIYDERTALNSSSAHTKSEQLAVQKTEDFVRHPPFNWLCRQKWNHYTHASTKTNKFCWGDTRWQMHCVGTKGDRHRENFSCETDEICETIDPATGEVRDPGQSAVDGILSSVICVKGNKTFNTVLEGRNPEAAGVWLTNFVRPPLNAKNSTLR